MPDLLTLYHRLPYPLRVAAATARGLYLRAWRYGAETEALAAQALEREHWPAARWQAWREERLAHLLHRAATRVPFYRAQWQERRRRGDRSPWDQLASWPTLPKEAVRADPEAFLADDHQGKRLFVEHTSGTTGTPLTLYWPRTTVRAWYALFEARSRRWYGVDRHQRWANIGGQLVAPVEERRPPYWVWNPALHQLYLSSYHLAPDTVGAYLEALVRHRVTYLLGYPSSLHSLAHLAQTGGHQAPPMQVAIANAEPLYDHQRATIAAVFGCPVRETYGMAEIACAAGECEAGSLHLWPEVGTVEVLSDDGDQAVSPGLSGRIIATGLLNEAMPLIRYETGDRGALAAADAPPCACGRSLPCLAGIEGRMDDLLRTPDGRRVGRMDPVFKADFPLREAQIVQRRLEEVIVKVVPTPGFDASWAEKVAARVRLRLGTKVTVRVETVEAIPRTRAGKLKAVVSELATKIPDSSDRQEDPSR